jgi:type IV pilus assembly protein PilX
MLSRIYLNQRGVVLLTALLWLMLLTVVALGIGRLLRDEQHIGSNLDDAQLAFRLAETALQAGEAALPGLPQLARLGAMSAVELNGPTSPFTLTCRQPRNPPPWQQGLCLSAALAGQAYPAPWQQRDSAGLALLHPCGAAQRVALQPVSSGHYCPGVTPGPWYWADPHYLVELLDPHYLTPQGPGILFRVTARGWGKQAGSVATVQSHVLLELAGSAGHRLQRLSWRRLS